MRLTLLIILIFIFLSSFLSAQEQGKNKIQEVKIVGNESFSDKKLHKLILSRPSSFLKKYYFYPEIFKDDLESIELFYHQNGYLDAKVTRFETMMDSIYKNMKILIELYEGPLTLVDSIAIQGHSSFSKKIILSRIKIKKGNPLARKRIEDSELALLSFYADQGYLNAEIKPVVSLAKEINKATIEFIIKENQRYTINKINIKGIEKTDENIIRRELNYKGNDIVNYSEILKSQRKIYLTGLFQSVFIQPVESSDGDSTKKDILIEVKENYSGEFNISSGFGSIEKFRVKTELYNNNLKGTARKIGFSANMSFIRRSIETSFSAPWTFGFPWSTDVLLAGGYFEEPGYNYNKFGGKISLARSLLNNSKIILRYRHENVTLKKVKVTNGQIKDKSDIRSLTMSYTYDSRNNLFNTTKGFYLEGSYELAGSFLSGSNTFSRAILISKYFYNINQTTVLASSCELGWMYASGGINNIPLQERFYTGGPNSLRGFEYKKVGPLDGEHNPLGGRFKLVLNLLEIRQTIYKFIGGVIFIDAGNVWKHPELFKINDLRTSPGAGIRIYTPIGLIRFDYGINLYPEEEEPVGMPYFSMGHAF
jgi:outer membrane protein insertion porin family